MVFKLIKFLEIILSIPAGIRAGINKKTQNLTAVNTKVYNISITFYKLSSNIKY